MFHGSGPNTFQENDLNAKTQHLSVNCEKYVMSQIEHRVDLNSSGYMHDPCFMALALIVSKKMT